MPIKKKQIKVVWNDQEFTVKKSRYTQNDRLALALFDAKDEHWTNITVNLVNIPLKPNEIAVKTYSENEGILQPLAEAGIIDIKSCREVPVGFTTAAVCKLTADLDEIDEWK